MFIILIAHTPGNAWTLWIPARWGFSDATEIFVFCSGMASAIAFGRTFDRAGWRWARRASATASGRSTGRISPVHGHAGDDLAPDDADGLARATTRGSSTSGRSSSIGGNWDREHHPDGLLTLTYVPNYFDILPMYMVVLA